jgi:hypothetical protein
MGIKAKVSYKGRPHLAGRTIKQYNTDSTPISKFASMSDEGNFACNEQ